MVRVPFVLVLWSTAFFKVTLPAGRGNIFLGHYESLRRSEWFMGLVDNLPVRLGEGSRIAHMD